MRLLVECTHCQRQYDATRRKIGSRFRCHCGEPVTVRQPQGHEARVVRCSSCGASRAENSATCPYCQSDFTLHERDLNTVCPHCLARVSDRARFCHHCGTGLVADLDADAETDLVCPACLDQCLVSRRIGTEKIAIMECGQCAGFWLGHDAFRQLLERAKREALPAGAILETPREVASKFGLPAGSVVPEARSGGPRYRPCPVCEGLMNRRNYGGNSGVIIDLCREDGLWFDAEELARILVWVRAGGVERPKPQPKRDDDPEFRDGVVMEQPRTFLSFVLDILFGPRGGRW